MRQDEDENEDKNQSFRSFWNFCMTSEPILQFIIVLRAWSASVRSSKAKFIQSERKLSSSGLFSSWHMNSLQSVSHSPWIHCVIVGLSPILWHSFHNLVQVFVDRKGRCHCWQNSEKAKSWVGCFAIEYVTACSMCQLLPRTLKTRSVP